MVKEITLHEAGNWLYGGRGAISFYLSLGNPNPPVLNEEYDLVENPAVLIEHVPSLLAQYRRLSEELLLDPRLKDFRFLPQLHVLVYGNESKR
jgi:hypothetical protein